MPPTRRRDYQFVFQRGRWATPNAESDRWDIKSLGLTHAQKPVKVYDDLPASYGETTVAYSPNGSKFFTGCDGMDSGKTSSTGSLQVFDAQTLERVAKISSSEQNAVCATWHQRLNQLFIGSGTNDRKLGSRGKTSLLYDTNLSAVDRGAMLAIGKNPRSKNADDFYRRVDFQNILHVPNALPLFQEPVDKSGRKRRLNKIERNDPTISKSLKPTAPAPAIARRKEVPLCSRNTYCETTACSATKIGDWATRGSPSCATRKPRQRTTSTRMWNQTRFGTTPIRIKTIRTTRKDKVTTTLPTPARC